MGSRRAESAPGGSAQRVADPHSHYRKGVAGNWRSHFDQYFARNLENPGPGLLRTLGYGADPD